MLRIGRVEHVAEEGQDKAAGLKGKDKEEHAQRHDQKRLADRRGVFVQPRQEQRVEHARHDKRQTEECDVHVHARGVGPELQRAARYRKGHADSKLQQLRDREIQRAGAHRVPLAHGQQQRVVQIVVLPRREAGVKQPQRGKEARQIHGVAGDQHHRPEGEEHPACRMRKERKFLFQQLSHRLSPPCPDAP